MLLVPSARALLAQEQAEDVQSLLTKGWYNYEQGDLGAALAAFEKALALNPSNDAVQSFVDAVTPAKIYEMIRSKDPRIAGMGAELLKLSTAEVVAKVNDPQRIKDAIGDVLSSEDQDQLVKLIRYTITFGRNLVPQLIPYLADSDIARRTVVINWVVRIGVDSVPVLQCARKHPDATVRQNVAYLLGSRRLRHAASLATLKAFMETDQSPDVREAAEKSFRAILSDLNGRGHELSAKEYFLQNAYGLYYLNPHKNPFTSSFYVPTIFKLEGEKIVGEEVAPFQLSERMAQQALEEALGLDPDFTLAQILLVCNDAAQVAEYDLNVKYYEKHEGRGNIKELLARQRPYVDYVLRNRVLASPAVLSDALLQALDDGKAGVARAILGVMREVEIRGGVPESLLKALEDTNSRRVRTGAAVTLAYWNPIKNFDAGEQVIKILSDSVYASGIRTVQKVMGNRRVANYLDAIFRDLNMETYSPIDRVTAGYEAIVRSPPDVVFMDESVKLPGKGVASINDFVNELRKNYRSANVPVVIVVPSSALDASRELYENEERKVWVVPENVDRLNLERDLFRKLFKDKDDAKTLATLLAAQAGQALNYLATVPTRFPVGQSVPTLIKVLANRPDEVRVPCLKALGNLHVAEALGELSVVFSRVENAKEVRLEAMRAIGKTLAYTGQAAPGPVLQVIEAGMQEKDLGLRRVAWYAFLNAKAPGDARLKAWLAQPPGPEAAPETPEAGGAKEPPAAEEPSAAKEEPAVE